jgi:hypothetical protein
MLHYPFRTVAAMATATAFLGVAAGARGSTADDPPTAHVRSESAAIVALIARSREASPTFRRLVERIDSSDGVVYVSDAACLDGQRACFIGVSMGGSRRNLWVHVDVHRHDDNLDVIRSIAHELRHTLEVLEVPSITSTAAMLLFYQGLGYRGGARSYETQAAVDAGEVVRDEVRASVQRGRAK